MTASIQDKKLMQRRRAIYTGLLPYLEGEDIYTALWLWQDRFSSQPALALHAYIHEITPLMGKAVSRSELHRSLVAAQGRSMGELAPDPYNDMLAYREGRLKVSSLASEQTVAVLPSTRVFEAILFEYFQSIDTTQPSVTDKIRRYIAQHVTHLDLPLPAFTELGHWLNGLRVHLHQPYTVEEIRRLLHIGYIGGCEYLGPTMTDTLLATAVKKTERLPEAMAFPPRQLL